MGTGWGIVSRMTDESAAHRLTDITGAAAP
jgi:hypothetical protein